MMHPSIKIILSVALLSTCLAPATLAQTIQVPADQPTIAAALAASSDGYVVLLAAGTYLEHDLILPSGVTIRGATGDPADVIIDAERAGRCIYGAGLEASTRLEALTLSNGLPSYGTTPSLYWGGGLYVDEGTLTVDNCLFLGNEASTGGGSYVRGTGVPTFIDCVFDANQATESAGLLLRGTCDPVVRNCEFRNATRTLYGGGVTWGGGGELLLEGCIIEDNAVYETGGGLEVIGTTTVATVRDCTIRRNTAGIGGAGLYLSIDARVSMETSTIFENDADQYGGGVAVGGGCVLEALECAIAGNTAPTGPDGIISSTGMVTLTCCSFDSDQWHVLGTLTIDDNCGGVANETATWGEVKALFR